MKTTFPFAFFYTLISLLLSFMIVHGAYTIVVRPSAEAVLQHHERLDGSGYPQGLRGEAISLEGRILAVADTVEAMATHRPYRFAKGIGAALATIEAGKGTMFDPAVVEACLRLFTQKGFQLASLETLPPPAPLVM